MRDKKFLLLVIGVLFVLVTFFLGKDSINPQESLLGEKERETFRVIKVIDGDTIQVLVGGKKETVRLIGIDTPDTVDPKMEVECFGKEASDKMKSLLNDKSVVLKNDPNVSERDKYGRLLRYIFLKDDTNVNKLMIQEGYAHEYTYESNPYKYQSEFRLAEKKAQDQKKGLWTGLKPSSCSKDK